MEALHAEELQVISFEIIMASGDGRSDIHEAFGLMRNDQFDAAESKLDEAKVKINTAHHAQTGLLQNLANGIQMPIDVLMIHAQDHLMTTMTLHEVAHEMLFLHRTR